MLSQAIVPWCEELLENGWAVGPSVLPSTAWDAMARLKQATLNENLLPAGTGKGQDYRAQSVRGDRIRWLDPGRPLDAAVLAPLDALRQTLREELRLPLSHQEAHLAWYPPGAGYARHLDSFRKDNARLVSLVCYLNPGWQPPHGGCLRLHLPTGTHDVPPQQGTAALFLSECIEHEVLPSAVDRWSLACWFRR